MQRKWGGGGSARARGNLESLSTTFWDLMKKENSHEKDSAGVKSKPVTSDRLVNCHTGMKAITVQHFKYVTDVTFHL